MDGRTDWRITVIRVGMWSSSLGSRWVALCRSLSPLHLWWGKSSANPPHRSRLLGAQRSSWAPEHFQKHKAFCKFKGSFLLQMLMTITVVLVGKLNPSLINQPVYCRLIVAWLVPTLVLKLPPPLFALQPFSLQTPGPGTGWRRTFLSPAASASRGCGRPTPHPPSFQLHQTAPRMPTQSSQLSSPSRCQGPAAPHPPCPPCSLAWLFFVREGGRYLCSTYAHVSPR